MARPWPRPDPSHDFPNSNRDPLLMRGTFPLWVQTPWASRGLATSYDLQAYSTTAKAPPVICFVSWQFGPLGSVEDGALQTPELLKMYGIVYIKGWKCR